MADYLDSHSVGGFSVAHERDIRTSTDPAWMRRQLGSERLPPAVAAWSQIILLTLGWLAVAAIVLVARCSVLGE